MPNVASVILVRVWHGVISITTYIIEFMNNKKWKLIKWSTGLLSLYLDWRLRKPRKWRPLDIFLIDLLMKYLIKSPQNTAFSETKVKTYDSIIASTVFWHGNGRFQYSKQGKVIDVLENMLKHDGTQPFEDLFDLKHGKMLSTSVARSRMYARIYADMHDYNGADLKTRYSSPRFWAYYFIMAINLHAIKELGLWDSEVRAKQHAEWRKLGKEVWAVKVRKYPGEATGIFFNHGSDIPGNYPILIGIEQGNYKFLKTADYVARYESRIGSKIPTESFTHLEVPEAKVAETKKLLARHGHTQLPVFSLESCEKFHASEHFSDLVLNNSR